VAIVTEHPLANELERAAIRLKNHGKEVDAGRWQGIPTEGHPDLITKEILNLSFEAPMPWTVEDAQKVIIPSLPWAEDHFRERVSHIPSNPGEEYKRWPWWNGQTAETMEGGVFSHTYQERFWPKYEKRHVLGYDIQANPMQKRRGIRYEWGDLDDVLSLLLNEPYTRQAYFPIFFPEDTGAKHGGRIPCTLGYHFLLRSNRLHCWYDIRSCDAVRHFRDDVYLTVRLVQWVLEQLRALEQGRKSHRPEQLWAHVRPGTLHFCAHSFHVHMGDINQL
jgi:hypothetical protein